MHKTRRLGGLTGVVTDPSGAFVPGALVEIPEAGTRVEHTREERAAQNVAARNSISLRLR